jgi:Flp pilus assembly protein TadG
MVAFVVRVKAFAQDLWADGEQRGKASAGLWSGVLGQKRRVTALSDKTKSFTTLLVGLVKDEAGHILIYFTLLAPVIFGMIGLALEGGRFFMVNSELQDLADAASLAGAKELNGEANAMSRATDKAQNLLTGNNPIWAEVGATGVQIARIEFRTCIDQASCAPLDTSDPDNDKLASFITVTTVTRGVFASFVRAAGATTNPQTLARATAGSTLVACNVQPMMLCNPYQPVGENFHASAGQMFHLKTKGDSSQGGTGNSFAPGDFGLLDPPGYNSSGAPLIRDLLSQQSPNFCYIDNVSPRTGQAAQKVTDGINVRFDQIPSSCKNPGSCPGLGRAPDQNVIDGFQPKNGTNCNQFEQYPGGYFPLPDDSGWNTIGNVQIGSAGPTQAQKDQYWSAHHGAGLTWPADAPTRYSAYLKEIGCSDASCKTAVPPPAWVGERHTPGTGSGSTANSCTGANPDTSAKRRIISVAIVNCLNDDGTPAIYGNAVTSVRSKSYADFFITRPSADGDVWAEFVQMITPDTESGKLHAIVQLYPNPPSYPTP